MLNFAGKKNYGTLAGKRYDKSMRNNEGQTQLGVNVPAPGTVKRACSWLSEIRKLSTANVLKNQSVPLGFRLQAQENDIYNSFAMAMTILSTPFISLSGH